MNNFQRTYSITIWTPKGERLVIKPPISTNFSIQRNTLSSANRAKVTIYNLGESFRHQIARDRYTNLNSFWAMVIQGGYDGELSNVFQGNIQEAYSSKEGTEWVTTIDAFDGMYAIQNGNMSMTLEGGTSTGDILREAASNLPNVLKMVVSETVDQETPTGRGTALEGKPMEILEEVSGLTPYIDNETLYLLRDNEVVKGEAYVLRSHNLLETPRGRDALLTVRTIFLPKVQVGRLCDLKSLEKRFDGLYKIIGFSHEVEVSGASGGRATTTLQLNLGSSFIEVSEVPNQKVIYHFKR